MVIIPPWFIAVLALANTAFLAWRFWRKRNWLIFSASLPRLYLFAVYTYFALADVPADVRAVYIRWGIALMMFVEIVNHIGARYVNDPG